LLKKFAGPSSLALAVSLLTASVVHANPSGEEVVAGAADFVRAASSLNILQQSDKVIINWQDFSVGADELTSFIQPSALSSALNRITSGNPSQILGTLQANGQV